MYELAIAASCNPTLTEQFMSDPVKYILMIAGVYLFWPFIILLAIFSVIVIIAIAATAITFAFDMFKKYV